MGLISGTFGIEELWLRKALRFARSDPVFLSNKNRENAQQELGMGNKQIDALVDWLVSSNLIERSKKDKIQCFYLTELGKLTDKYDADFSEDGIFWVIHYYLSQDKNKLWFYYWYVNEFEKQTFSRSDIEIGLSNFKASTKKVINNLGVLPLLQTMRKTRLGKSFGIMVEDDTNQFRRIEPPEDKLDPIVVAYITVDWAKRNERNSANLAELTGLKESPGKILHLSTRRYCEYLDKIQAMFNKEILWVSYTAGLNSVTFEKDTNPLDLLKAYYIKKRDEISALDAYHKAKKEVNKCQ